MDILEESTYNFHFFYIQNVVDYSLKFTYVFSRYGKISKANKEVISWSLFTSTSFCLTYVA